MSKQKTAITKLTEEFIKSFAPNHPFVKASKKKRKIKEKLLGK